MGGASSLEGPLRRRATDFPHKAKEQQQVNGNFIPYLRVSVPGVIVQTSSPGGGRVSVFVMLTLVAPGTHVDRVTDRTLSLSTFNGLTYSSTPFTDMKLCLRPDVSRVPRTWILALREPLFGVRVSPCPRLRVSATACSSLGSQGSPLVRVHVAAEGITDVLTEGYI